MPLKLQPSCSPPISAITPEQTAAHTDTRAWLQTAISLGTKPSPQVTPSIPTAQAQTQRQLDLFQPSLQVHMTRSAQNSPHKSPSPSGLKRGSRCSAPAQPWGLSSWGPQEKPPDSTWGSAHHLLCQSSSSWGQHPPTPTHILPAKLISQNPRHTRSLPLISS